MINLLIGNAVLIAVCMVTLWLLSILLRDVSIVDLFWGLGFVLVAWNTCWNAGEWSFRAPSNALLPLLVSVWGLRLTGHLAIRNIGHGEDKRYVAMRAARPGTFWWQSLLIVFGLQGVVMWLVALPLQTGILQPVAGWHWQHFLGLLLWGIGFFFEAVGDWQLMRFRRNPVNRGRVLDRGLWRYTRHPNYFGDFCVWWGLFVVSTAHGVHLWTVLSPLLMSLFLIKVSGVTLLESTLVEKPDYADYIRRTNAFFPGPRQTSAETDRSQGAIS